MMDLDSFVHFTDTLLWELLRDHARNAPQSAAAALFGRKKLKHVATEYDLGEPDKADLLKRLREKLGCEVIAYESPIKFSRIGPRFAQIRVLATSEDGTRSLVSLQDRSTFFDKFRDVIKTQFFIKPQFIP